MSSWLITLQLRISTVRMLVRKPFHIRFGESWNFYWLVCAKREFQRWSECFSIAMVLLCWCNYAFSKITPLLSSTSPKTCTFSILTKSKLTCCCQNCITAVDEWIDYIFIFVPGFKEKCSAVHVRTGFIPYVVFCVEEPVFLNCCPQWISVFFSNNAASDQSIVTHTFPGNVFGTCVSSKKWVKRSIRASTLFDWFSVIHK